MSLGSILGDETMSLYLEISPQAEALLKEAASNRGIDVSTLIEGFATSNLIQPISVVPAPWTSGLTAGEIIRRIGFAEGGPTDLSTNPVHMEGFGETKSLSNGSA